MTQLRYKPKHDIRVAMLCQGQELMRKLGLPLGWATSGAGPFLPSQQREGMDSESVRERWLRREHERKAAR